MRLGRHGPRALPLSACVACAVAACGGESRPPPDVAATPPANTAVVEVGCADGAPSAERRGPGDLPFGSFVLIGLDESGERAHQRHTGIDRPPDAFNRRGYKVPISLRDGTSSVLSVPSFERGRLGLVFTQAAQRRVLRDGVGGADATVRFTACPAEGASGRTGWPGGFVVDEPHCATVTVDAGRSPTTNFGLPLGRPCPPPR